MLSKNKPVIISIIQPSFLPWLGYFEQIVRADVFVYMDDVQYTSKDWRNRNRLKSKYGIKMISVPVKNASRNNALIKEALISYEENWKDSILNKISEWYKNAEYFKDHIDKLTEIINKNHTKLVDLIYDLNNYILKYLKVPTPIAYASSIPKNTSNKNLRIIEICRYFSANVLYDGKAAELFIDKELFEKNGIDVIFQDYKHKPYSQLWGEFVPFLSVLDLMMNCGQDSIDYILASPVPNKRIR